MSGGPAGNGCRRQAQGSGGGGGRRWPLAGGRDSASRASWGHARWTAEGFQVHHAGASSRQPGGRGRGGAEAAVTGEGRAALSIGRCCLARSSPRPGTRRQSSSFRGAGWAAPQLGNRAHVLRGQDSSQLSPVDSMSPAPCPVHDSEQTRSKPENRDEEGLSFPGFARDDCLMLWGSITFLQPSHTPHVEARCAAAGQCLLCLQGRWSRSELGTPGEDVWAGREPGGTSVALGAPARLLPSVGCCRPWPCPGCQAEL